MTPPERRTECLYQFGDIVRICGHIYQFQDVTTGDNWPYGRSGSTENSDLQLTDSITDNEIVWVKVIDKIDSITAKKAG